MALIDITLRDCAGAFENGNGNLCSPVQGLPPFFARELEIILRIISGDGHVEWLRSLKLFFFEKRHFYRFSMQQT